MKNFVSALILIVLMTDIILEVPAKGLYQVMDFIPPREPRIAGSTITATLTLTCTSSIILDIEIEILI